MKRSNLMRKKLTALLTSAILTTAFMAGCGNGAQTSGEANQDTQTSEVSEALQDTQSAEGESSIGQSGEETGAVTYPVETQEKLTVMMRLDPNLTTLGYTSYEGTPFGRELEAKTGIDIEWIQPADNNALLLALAGGDLPDIVIMNYDTYTGGINQLAKDGIAIPITSYLESCAPDYLAVLNSNDDYLKGVKNADKEIYSFAFLRGDISTLSWRGVIARKDWLDDLNMEVPNTIDEFYDMLIAFRDEKGAVIPFSTRNDWVPLLLTDGLITSAFGLPTAEEYQIEGTYHYGAYEDAYKDCLTFLNKLYAEGLLDVNWQTTDETTTTANLLTGISGVHLTTSGRFESIMGSAKEENFDIVAIPSLTAEEGDTPMYNLISRWVDSDQNAFITESCENVELAMKFLNYAYSEEGNILYNFGVEGESYEMQDGTPLFTDLIMNNPDGVAVTTIMSAYIMSYKSGPLVQDKLYYDQRMAMPQQQESAVTWGSTDVLDYKIQTISIPEEFASEYVNLWSDINTYISEMRAKFITGEESLDNFAAYQENLQKMGMDRIIEIKQMALDEYNSR